jgi:hypothetical protein
LVKRPYRSKWYTDNNGPGRKALGDMTPAAYRAYVRRLNETLGRNIRQQRLKLKAASARTL